MREVIFNRDGSESIQALLDRIRELEEERDIFARTLDKRDAECAEQHRVIDIRNQRIRELEQRIRELEDERDRLREALEYAAKYSDRETFDVLQAALEGK